MVMRPYVLLSAAVSVDGRLDDTSQERLVLSNHRDLDRVDGERVDGALPRARRTLAALADVVSTGPVLDWPLLLDELGRRGVERLLVEGGGTVHTQLLAQNLADELHLVVAPLLVGEAAAPPFLGPARYSGGPRARMKLLDARSIDDVVLLRYAPKDRS
jgi:riboflavin biosynthesis pyrimidine reductase